MGSLGRRSSGRRRGGRGCGRGSSGVRGRVRSEILSLVRGVVISRRVGRPGENIESKRVWGFSLFSRDRKK